MLTKEQLISQLSKDLQPVQVLPSAFKRYLVWSVCSFLVVAIGFLVVHSYRQNFSSDLQQLFFLIETIMALAPFFTSGLLVIHMSVPGQKMNSTFYVIVYLTVILYFAMTTFNYFVHVYSTSVSENFNRHCIIEVMAWSWVPILGLVYQLKKGYALLNKRLLLLVALAGVSLPVGLMQVACLSTPQHNLYYHIAPAAVVMLIFLLVGEHLIKFNNR